MKVPPNYTEKEVLDIIEKCVSVLAPTFTFGYYDVKDIKQEGAIFAIELLEKGKYDPKRPLENYIYTHVRNRLINLRRDKFRRSDPPCRRCHHQSPCTNGRFCDAYQKWYDRNAAKASIMQPAVHSYMEETQAAAESDISIEAQEREFLEKIDQELPVELRAHWQQMLAGVRLHKSKREKVQEAIWEILADIKPDE